MYSQVDRCDQAVPTRCRPGLAVLLWEQTELMGRHCLQDAGRKNVRQVKTSWSPRDHFRRGLKKKIPVPIN